MTWWIPVGVVVFFLGIVLGDYGIKTGVKSDTKTDTKTGMTVSEGRANPLMGGRKTSWIKKQGLKSALLIISGIVFVNVGPLMFIAGLVKDIFF